MSVSADIGPIKKTPSIGPLQPGGNSNLVASVSDSLSLNDNFSLVAQLFSSPSESISLQESLSLVAGIQASIAENFSLSDAISVDLEINVELTASVSDALSFVDGTPLSDLESPIFDNLIFVDGMTLALTGVIQLAAGDTITFEDSVSFPNVIQLRFSETISLMDSQIYDNLAFADSLAFGDSVSLFFGGAQVSDTFALTDSEALTVGIVESKSDTLSLSDSIMSIVNIAIGVGDFFIVGELLAVAGPKTFAFADNLLLTDNAMVGVGGYSFADSLEIIDEIEMALAISLATSDSFNLSDSVIVPVMPSLLKISISDLIALADAVSVSVPSVASNTNYYRQYLNDVVGQGNK